MPATDARSRAASNSSVSPIFCPYDHVSMHGYDFDLPILAPIGATFQPPGFCEFSTGTRLFYPDRHFAGRVARPFIAVDAFETREHPRGHLRCTDVLVHRLGELCFFRSELCCR